MEKENMDEYCIEYVVYFNVIYVSLVLHHGCSVFGIWSTFNGKKNLCTCIQID